MQLVGGPRSRGPRKHVPPWTSVHQQKDTGKIQNKPGVLGQSKYSKEIVGHIWLISTLFQSCSQRCLEQLCLLWWKCPCLSNSLPFYTSLADPWWAGIWISSVTSFVLPKRYWYYSNRGFILVSLLYTPEIISPLVNKKKVISVM